MHHERNDGVIELPGLESLAGRTALVTGASSGIGRAIAERLSKEGMRVVMVARSQDRLSRAAEEVGGVALAADASTEGGVREIVERSGTPDVLVCSAGAFELARLGETSVESFDRHLSANLRGPFLLMRALLPRMAERGSGHLVTIGSVAGRIPLPGNAAYGASKYGLRGLHEVVAEELRGTGVRATLVEPAATDTPLWDALEPDRNPDLPSREAMLRPEDVARAVWFVLAQPPHVEIPLLPVRALS